jgi:hypothetical protein
MDWAPRVSGSSRGQGRAVSGGMTPACAPMILVLPFPIGSGEVSFTISVDHARVTNYEARIRVFGNSTVVGTKALGVPTPDSYSVCVVNLQSLYDLQSPGDYTISIAATTPSGTTDSAESNAFTLPLP